MVSRLADARAALYNALNPVLPGRVDPYPPPAGRVVAPKIWIGDHDGNPATIGTATTVTVARFAVWIVYDGAVHAQVAGLDSAARMGRLDGRVARGSPLAPRNVRAPQGRMVGNTHPE